MSPTQGAALSCLIVDNRLARGVGIVVGIRGAAAEGGGR